MTTSVFLAPTPILQFFNNLGQPNAGGSVLTQVGGVNYPTYEDSAGNTPLPNPIPLNSRGEVSNSSGISTQLFLEEGVVYTFTLYDASHNQINQATWMGSNFIAASDYSNGYLNRVVNSIADLRAIKSSLYTRVFVTGYYSSGDGGGGVYWYDPTDTTSTDNGGSIIVANDGARWHLVPKTTIGVKEFGAKEDGVTDDSVAVNNARAYVQNSGGAIFYGGIAAGGTDTRARANEWLLGSSATYATNLSSRYPLTHASIYNATPTTGAGYAHFGHRTDYTTKTGIDVQSSVGFSTIFQSFSTNSAGANFSNTNQVGGLFNCSAMDSASSASVEGLNVITQSNYIGTLAHNLTGLEVDISSVQNPGFFGGASTHYGVGISVQNVGATKNITLGLSIDTSTSGIGFLHGALISGVVNSGITIARNTITPAVGMWVSAAGTYGVYIGAKPLFNLNSGQTPAYDSLHNPAIGLALGETAATSGISNKLRFISTNSSSAENNLDLYTNNVGDFQFDYNGANKFLFSAAGGFYIAGNQVLTSRIGGWGTPTGGVRIANFPGASATLLQCSEAIAQLITDLEFHGLLGG